MGNQFFVWIIFFIMVKFEKNYYSFKFYGTE